MSEYTSTPWEVQPYDGDEDGVGIVGLPFNGLVALATLFPTEIDADDPSRAKANAAFIVKAANSHGPLVKALEKIIDFDTDTSDDGKVHDHGIFAEIAIEALKAVGNAGKP